MSNEMRAWHRQQYEDHAIQFRVGAAYVAVCVLAIVGAICALMWWLW